MNLFKSIATFGGFTLLSRITGFLRDMVLANFLGAGVLSDAFFVAFKLPHLLRSFLAEGAFTSAVVRMVSQKLVAENKESALLFAAKAIAVLTFFLGFFVILFEIFMPYIVPILAPGFVNDSGKIELAINLSRITFPFLLFISIVSFHSGVLNSFNKFAAPAAAPVSLDSMMILSVFIFMPFGETPAHSIALGVTTAGFLEILWLSFFLKRQQATIKPQYNIFSIIKDAEIQTLFKRIAPGTLGAGIYQINMVVDTILVSLVGSGAISWLYYANRLQQLPLGVVGAAIGVAVLPVLSRYIKADQIDEARAVQSKAFECGALLSIPAAFALIVLAEPTINILFQHGKFGFFETVMTAKAVVVYAIGLPAYVLVKSLAPNFFARGDTKTPVKYSIIVLLTNLTFAVILMKPFGHVGIAAATTIAAFVSLWQYLRGLKKRNYWTCSKELIGKLLKITFCSLIMAVILKLELCGLNLYFENWLYLSFVPKIALYGFICIIGFSAFITSAEMTKIISLKDILNQLKNKRK
ncbi:MAG: murein biosynthesis integral membrane protein MurJ [Alphaproteobacteria bacterium]|nr:murein biosynthesis integral membrane protein MurJ [Alphaproteobacteria bacterium]